MAKLFEIVERLFGQSVDPEVRPTDIDVQTLPLHECFSFTKIPFFAFDVSAWRKVLWLYGVSSTFMQILTDTIPLYSDWC